MSSNLWTGVKYDLTVSEKREKKQRRLRRYYDEEFKRNAVEMLETGERSAVQLARELGVSDCSLGTWKRLYGKEASAKRSPAGEQQARIQYLERELERVSRQRDILKKALGILGQEPGNFTK